jgi:alpha-D-ribose 1-methylphosphonate 5-triphosphate synthase subunit PhnL
MNKKERKELVSVKIEKTVVDMVREWKRGTFVPIGIFFSEAAKEKLEKEKNKKD